MTTLREAAQQALEALDSEHPDIQLLAAAALRDALEQPAARNQCGETCERAKLCAVCARGLDEQEPVAIKDDDGLTLKVGWDDLPVGAPLYTHPPRQWRGLKEWEINDGRDQLPTEDLCNWSFRQGVYFAEKALKEKNT
jgi:hypothetical protein